MNTLSKFLDWPPIVQGILGSAAFWLILVLSQRGIGRLAKFEGLMKKEGLYRQLIHEKLMRQHSDGAMTMCTYQAFGHLVRGIIFLGFGLILSSAAPVFLAIGGAGFIYYAFRASRWLKLFTVEPDETDLQLWERIADVEAKLYGAPDNETLAKVKSLRDAPPKETAKADRPLK